MFKFEPLLQEGQRYVISNFGVAENGGRLPLVPHKWKLSSYKGTDIFRADHIDTNYLGIID